MRERLKKLSMAGSTRTDLKWRIIVFLILITYCYVMHKTIGVRPDHFFLSLIILVFLIFGREWGIKFLIDWSPFIIFWIAYDMMHGIADSMKGYIHVAEPFNLEHLLFGWMSGFPVPAFYLQHFQITHDGSFVKLFMDLYSTAMYLLHFIAPLLLGWFFWHTLNERRTYYLFVYTFTVLNVMALITFMIFPSAPPWYIYKHGFVQPMVDDLSSAGALVNFDKLLGGNYLQSLWDTFNSNRFAAIPSLHSGYPTVIVLLLWLRFRGITWIFIGYPLSVWFAAVYLNHHYIIDLIIGSCYAIVAYYIAKNILLPHVFDNIINFNESGRQSHVSDKI